MSCVVQFVVYFLLYKSSRFELFLVCRAHFSACYSFRKSGSPIIVMIKDPVWNIKEYLDPGGGRAEATAISVSIQLSHLFLARTRDFAQYIRHTIIFWKYFIIFSFRHGVPIISGRRRAQPMRAGSTYNNNNNNNNPEMPFGIFYDIIKIFFSPNKDAAGKYLNVTCLAVLLLLTTRLKHHVINNSSNARVISSFINCLPDDDDWILHVSERQRNERVYTLFRSCRAKVNALFQVMNHQLLLLLLLFFFSFSPLLPYFIYTPDVSSVPISTAFAFGINPCWTRTLGNIWPAI